MTEHEKTLIWLNTELDIVQEKIRDLKQREKDILNARKALIKIIELEKRNSVSA